MFGLEYLAVGGAFALLTFLIALTASVLSGDNNDEEE
jgi:hypothetical protein